MKTRGISVILIIILICTTTFFGGCKDSDDHSSEKAITSFSLNGANGTINENDKTIIVNMPSLTNVYSLVATFTTTGESVEIGTTQQVSGTTSNDFSSPVIYTVTAEDESTAVYTVTVTINRAWHDPANLADNISPDGQDTWMNNYIWRKQIVMDDNGNAIIVWVQSDGTNNQIYKSEYRNGVWTYPANLADNISPDDQDARNPHVAMDNNGNAIIVWSQSDGTNYQIFKSERRNGVWHNPVSLTDNISPDGQDAGMESMFGGDAQVAMDNNGNAIIVWYQGNGPDNHVFKSEYRNGTWTHPANLTDNIGINDASMPQVAMDDNGNAIIVFVASNGLFKSEYRNGAWHDPDNISTNALFPQVAMDNNGNAIIVWNDGFPAEIFKSEYRNGTWTHPVNSTDNISHSGTSSEFPQVEMDDNGNAIIVWIKRDSIDYAQWTILKSEHRNGIWTTPANISFNGQNTGHVHVDMDNNGNAIIAWSQSDGTNWQIFKSEYRDGVWINPTSFTDNISQDGQDAMNPQVAMGNNGNAIIVWEQFDGDNWQIFKSEYR